MHHFDCQWGQCPHDNKSDKFYSHNKSSRLRRMGAQWRYSLSSRYHSAVMLREINWATSYKARYGGCWSTFHIADSHVSCVGTYFFSTRYFFQLIRISYLGYFMCIHYCVMRKSQSLWRQSVASVWAERKLRYLLYKGWKSLYDHAAQIISNSCWTWMFL